MNIKDKNILVVGNARSGIGAAKLALSQGAKVCIYDHKPYSEWHISMQQEIDRMQDQGVTFCLGELLDVRDFTLVIVSPGVPLEIDVIQKAREKDIKVIGELEFASRFCKAPIIAITGTNGKTTTTTLVGEIFKQYNPHTYVVGNIGKAFSEEVLSIPETGIVVAEVSSFQLETIEFFHPRISALLNITPDHLNRHHTMKNYCHCKYNIFKNQNKDDFCILNIKDTYFKEAKEKAKGTYIEFSLQDVPERGAYLIGNGLYENINGKENFICSIEELKIKGTHNVENALAAVAITTAFGVPLHIIKNSLITFKGVAHRTEYVTTKKGIDFFNDSKATNTDAAVAGLIGLSSLNKPIRLIAGGMDKHTTFKDWIRLFSGHVKKVYVIGETKEQIVRECIEEGYTSTQIFANFNDAIVTAYEEGSEGECILLSPACASWDMFESYEQRGDLFKEIVNHLEG
ncbi:UDP-N-acetylmuramoyl-L-alanine--D-glutamate ligase [Cellulosilyticum sp. I15G10I2]|uniref:UDP-N-acetylmuramoyl-L-alanine--D-glutamate ligase n=1 Tax=Cellulosilyticum sp. I15G10I2 TaxID=1892843 RepID=UPI00085BB47C|nr:UDP-N-acetylmuramoyl-L-alanine--D-glutamate ligase [Cellulosilyticum sp. I15G10I2]